MILFKNFFLWTELALRPLFTKLFENLFDKFIRIFPIDFDKAVFNFSTCVPSIWVKTIPYKFEIIKLLYFCMFIIFLRLFTILRFCQNSPDIGLVVDMIMNWLLDKVLTFFLRLSQDYFDKISIAELILSLLGCHSNSSYLDRLIHVVAQHESFACCMVNYPLDFSIRGIIHTIVFQNQLFNDSTQIIWQRHSEVVVFRASSSFRLNDELVIRRLFGFFKFLRIIDLNYVFKSLAICWASVALTKNFEVRTIFMRLLPLVTPDVMVLLDTAVGVFTIVKAMWAMLGLLQTSFLS